MTIGGSFNPIQKHGFFAIFVDAGYLLAQGSAVAFGKKIEQKSIEINIDQCLEHMKDAFPFFHSVNLLRTYWYDGIKNNKLDEDQQKIARTDFIKFRAGTVNSANQQKGVDSLIVTDLIELARNKAITDALIVTGDGDLKIGMTIAQSFGVRVHLLGLGENNGMLPQETDIKLKNAANLYFNSQLPQDELNALRSSFKKALKVKETPHELDNRPR